MKLKAIACIQNADGTHEPGAVFTAVSAEEAEYLLEHGYAEVVESAKADKKAADAKADKKPAAASKADADDGL